MTAGQPRLFAAGQSATTSDDYYTPQWVFDALGLRFDLDVAAPSGGAPFVPADHYYTVEDDGLLQPWHGRVWMNPPYSNVTPWAQRFIEHRNGIALLPHVKATWRNEMWETADAFAEATGKGRSVRFLRSGQPVEIMFPTFFAAFGDECVAALRNIGPVRVRETPTTQASKEQA